MPQLAPVNWLFLFLLFWFIVALSSTLIWWSSKTAYSIADIPVASSDATTPADTPITLQSKSWSW